jgi:hypothetical protein
MRQRACSQTSSSTALIIPHLHVSELGLELSFIIIIIIIIIIFFFFYGSTALGLLVSEFTWS